MVKKKYSIKFDKIIILSCKKYINITSTFLQLLQ